MYQIDNASGRKRAPRMSPFPRRTRPFTEPLTATQDQQIGPGVTLPELIKKFYPAAVPVGIDAQFAFLDRDNKEKVYEPGKVDRYVFNGQASITMFHEHAKRLLAKLCDYWTSLGLPLKRDEDRGVDVPDSKTAWDALNPSHPLHNKVVSSREAVYFIIANADIMKKACVVRTVNHGWWAVSYAGKDAPNRDYFRLSLNAHKRAVNAILSSSKGKALYHKNWAESSDPITTNPGYPFYSVQLDSQGAPVTRIKTVELFRGLNPQAFSSWEKLLEEVDKRAGQFGMPGHPFCVAPIRRLQPGYKWQHQFNMLPSGLVTAYDERGVNSQRVAHMVPYVYNVITAPVSAAYKTVRMLLPGCYHDGESRIARLSILRKQDKDGKLFLAEADYSNFDRFMAVDLIAEIVSWFTSRTSNPSFWNDAMMHLHDRASLVWPDYSSVTSGVGWVFKPGRLGLLSGVKATSDTGTLVNSVVNGEALARTFGWSEDQLFQYLTQYLNAPVGGSVEYFYVQSDDTQLIQSNPGTLRKHGDLFMEATKAAGLKGSIELADRFLMRHIQGGDDRPVPARVWQNTLSNESPPESEIIFLAGLASRTDGLLGQKTVDPFQTGTRQTVTAVEAMFTLDVCESILSFVRAASSSSPVAVGMMSAYASLRPDVIASYKRGPVQGYTIDGAVAVKLDSMRHDITRVLAKFQLDAQKLANTASVTGWLYSLHKDKNIPSSASLRDELLALAPQLKSTFSTFEKKEEAFFRYATRALGVSPLTQF